MQIRELIADLPVTLVHGDADAVVRDITEDSRAVTLGSLFIARQGLSDDGRAYMPQAVAAGAVAVLTDDSSAAPPGAAVLVADDVPLVGARIAERLCGRPSRELMLVGVTGTNGKTTTAHLIQQLFNHSLTAQEKNKRRAGLIGTVCTDVGDGPEQAGLTTPPAMDISRLLQRMTARGCGACVMEVSSHALDQRRVAGLDFTIAVFTNLSGDHLDYHGSREHYLRAKARLFSMLPREGVAVVNRDDEAWEGMVADCAATVVGCSLRDGAAACFGTIRRAAISHTEATLRGGWGVIDVRLPLCGGHNVMNALQAAAVAHAAGVGGEEIRMALERCAVPPGRLEPVTGLDDPFAVYVDYAHSDDALENVLRAVRPLVPGDGRLHVVFGCGGDRDRSKRPRMAAIAARYADWVYVTSDNPRTENPEAIVDEVMDGIPASMRARTVRVVDRRAAIQAAIQAVRPKDVVLIAGKGHEDYQLVGTEKRPFDDRLVAREALIGREVTAEQIAPRQGVTR